MSVYCPYCAVSNDSVSEFREVKRTGHYWRISDGRWIQRFRCLKCHHGFSNATFHACYRQNKRDVNLRLLKELCSGVTQRRAAWILHIDRKTVARKLLFLGKLSEDAINEMNKQHQPSHTVEFDDMESFEHTKLKPISMVIMVEHKTRRILGLRTADLPAKGPLAELSRMKYGQRIDQRKFARTRLFEKVQRHVLPTATIKSDQHPHYPSDVRTFFPLAKHIRYKSRKPRPNGQGELKKGGFDPLFSFNHTAAMFRGNLGCLVRKTWNTTKKRACLEARMLLYAYFHNLRLKEKALKKAASRKAS